MTHVFPDEHRRLLQCLTVTFHRKPAESKRRFQDLMQQYFISGCRRALLQPAAAQVTSAEWQDAERQLSEAKERGVDVITFPEPEYPGALREIASAPLVLYVRGSLPKGNCLGIVGSRRASVFGKSFAQSIAQTISACGINIVSGLAFGIDTAAHRGAVDGGFGPGAAVLGCGVCRIYPRQNESLAEEIIAAGGAVISEYGLDAPPRNIFFPQRNRIISGLSKAVLVVEAQERSGALITARVAAEQGKDVFAVPGAVTSELGKGTNILLKTGAHPFTEIQDLFSVFPELVRQRRDQSPVNTKASIGTYTAILEILDRQLEKDFDTLIEESGLTAPALSRLLAEMELKGLVTECSGGLYVKN